MTPNGSKGEQGRRTRVETTKIVVIYGFAVLGVIFSVAIIAGLALDIASIDGTSGGYEPPYSDFTGEPIDWDTETYTSQTGMVSTGYVLDVHTDCTSGMISFEVLGVATVDYRELSDRAIAIHQPREACQERGFSPGF
jgi:hypothetical protein